VNPYEKRMPAALVLLVIVALGGIFGGALVEWYRDRGAATVDVSTQAQGQATKPAGYASDIDRLKDLVPSQSHTMSDVGSHWTNLWFAAEKKNWPLAQFYFEESRAHILWTIQLRPVRKGPDGNDVNLVPIFESIDTSAFKAVADAIQAQNSTAFTAAYRETLQACYGCHKTSGKPYLRPMVPTEPGQSIINVDAAATWPQ